MRPSARNRGRVAGPVLTAAVVVFSSGSLGALRLWAGSAADAPRHDALALALLRADLQRNPDDASARVRLVREQLALGMYRDAEGTLVPLLAAGTPSPATALLSLDVALAAWRAAPEGTPQR